ncbi:hypothetical protein [Microlunatus antarcticus]|uniref:Uncharacterized protein n=1 Tax=Microlunatus antarcticus TaxID=53388 RepID=A0A7W5P9H1_9ACTN|nr:hypothetical protein [Microlunatus antarcticus]MBB3328926.1 hypothetical protein [Microlunatus antarcticus]
MTDVEDAATELYALAPEDFVAARTALVKRARAARDRPLATEIGALRKPTRTAWVVNLLARDDPDAVGALLDLGDALRAAQEQRDGPALRDLSARRRKAIDVLVRRGTTLAREAGHPPTESTLNEVAQTLQAALGDPAVGAQVRGARLAGAAVYGGFGGPAESGPAPDGGDDLAAMLAASMPAAKQAGATPEDEVAERRRQAAAERRAALTEARDEARAALDEAQTAADAATEEADRRAEEVDRLKAELAQAEDAEREAATAARAAREEVRDRRTAAEEAEDALAALP